MTDGERVGEPVVLWDAVTEGDREPDVLKLWETVAECTTEAVELLERHFEGVDVLVPETLSLEEPLTVEE